MSVTDKLLGNAQNYAASYDKASLPMPPGLHVAIVACMDARINPYGIFGLTEAMPTSSATPAGPSPRMPSGPSPSPSACSAPRRSS